MLINNVPYGFENSRQEAFNLTHFMNTDVKTALNIPEHVIWGSQSNAVFHYLRGDFMKPVTDGSKFYLVHNSFRLPNSIKNLTNIQNY